MIIMSFADGKRLKSGPACGRSAGLPVSRSRHFLVYHIDSQSVDQSLRALIKMQNSWATHQI